MPWEAGFWGLAGGGALLLGAVIGWFVQLSRKEVAGAMACGAGALLAALPTALIGGAGSEGGIAPIAGGLLAGALVYSGLNYELGRRGAKHRKRSARLQRERDRRRYPLNGLQLALGALLDNLPKALLIAVSLAGGIAAAAVSAAAIILANISEGLSSAYGMKVDGRRFGSVLGLWAAMACIYAVASVGGVLALASANHALIPTTQAIATGAVLAMLVETMLPEAFEGTQDFSGLMAAVGFLAAFLLPRLA